MDGKNKAVVLPFEILVHPVLPTSHFNLCTAGRAPDFFEVAATVYELESIEDLSFDLVRFRSNAVKVLEGSLPLSCVRHETRLFRNDMDIIIRHRPIQR